MKWQSLISGTFSFKLYQLYGQPKQLLTFTFKDTIFKKLCEKCELFSVQGIYLHTDWGPSVKNPWPTSKFTNILLQDKEPYSVSSQNVTVLEDPTDEDFRHEESRAQQAVQYAQVVFTNSQQNWNKDLYLLVFIYCSWLGLDTLFVMKESERQVML